MAKQFILFALSMMTASFFVACSETETDTPVLPTVNKNVESKAPVSKEFKIPETSVISLEKAKAYVNTSIALMELASKWSEKIEQAKDQQKIEILNTYEKARNTLCFQLGLSGIAEYNWLDSVAIPNPENAKLLTEAGVKLP